jgi:hypothetical protein
MSQETNETAPARLRIWLPRDGRRVTDEQLDASDRSVRDSVAHMGADLHAHCRPRRQQDLAAPTTTRKRAAPAAKRTSSPHRRLPRSALSGPTAS